MKRLDSTDQSGRGLPQSKTLARSSKRVDLAKLLECASPLALSGTRPVHCETGATPRTTALK